MKNIILKNISIIAVLTFLSACGGKTLENYNALYNAQEYRTESKNIKSVFAAVKDVLYKQGYKITYNDIDSGTITAIKPKYSDFYYTGRVLAPESVFLQILNIFMSTISNGRTVGVFSVEQMAKDRAGVNLYLQPSKKLGKIILRVVFYKDVIYTGHSYKPENRSGRVVIVDRTYNTFKEDFKKILLNRG